MLSVNIIKDETEAYINNSTVTEGSGSSPPPLNVIVSANDAAEIVALGGAVGFGQKNGVGAAIGYNEIQSTILADLDGATLNVAGSVTVTAQSNQTIGGVVLGIGARPKTVWPLPARSASTSSPTPSTPISATAPTSRPAAPSLSPPPTNR